VNTTLATLAAITGLMSASVQAQTPSWYRPHNLVVPTVTASVSLDTSGNFRYRYSLSNGTSAKQKISYFFIELAVEPAGAESPADWYSILGTNSISWGSEGTIDPTWVKEHDADIATFLSEIAPGRSLTGFDLLSPCAASTTGLAYFVQGYNHLSKEPEDNTTTFRVPEWRADAVKGKVLGPADCSVVADWGNRRPGTDGFLGVVNFVSGATLPAGPATVQVRFARDGETVNRSTFSADLNGIAVTGKFVANARGDLVAVFSPGRSPAKAGTNVLLLKVDGLKPGTTQTATDVDRFTFVLP